MLLTLLFALALGGLALALVARAAVLPRIRADANVGRIAAYGYQRTEAPTTAPGRTPVLPKLAAWVGNVVAGGALAKHRDELRKILLAAGSWQTSPATVQGYRVLLSFGLGAMALWVAAKQGWSPFIGLILGVYGVGFGWIVPLFLIKSRARRRTQRIEIELPELIDRLVVTLEAGIGFNAAVQRAGQRMRGPLGEELRLTLHEHELGLTMQAALANLLYRCDVPSIRAFVRAVGQSEQLGISIGHVMRELASDIRKRRRQIIEERAQKAPIKMLFPLAFLVLPALLMVVLFPGVYNMVSVLGGTF
ncbi:MAG TPA: type II secretion system F family protein [Thermoleophilaceae bacterium]